MMAPVPTKCIKNVHTNREQKGRTDTCHSADTIKEKRVNTLGDEYVSTDGDYSKSVNTMIGFIGSASRVPK